eukprot:TRINITY_DN12833_c0_g1_i4.p1 TRINITY_DN12833_c0_g1~~TRINITY_DN12833_c0_g1_i4.p1  ORF type:complete len:327 (+),score=46.38 TRINITY_DN12833_c0_g1_i4:61-1041(+)
MLLMAKSFIEQSILIVLHEQPSNINMNEAGVAPQPFANPGQEIKQGLQLIGKRGTFFQGIEVLKSVSQQTLNADERQQLVSAIKRCGNILRTRYTSPQFWAQGLELFLAFKQHQQQQLLLDSSFNEFWLEDLIFAANEVTGRGSPPPNSINSPQLENQSTDEGNLQQQILDGVWAIANGMEAIQNGTERIEQELSRLMQITRGLRDQAEQSVFLSKPPASKTTIKNLPRMKIDDQNLKELSGDQTCAVCMERFVKNDDVIVMPCKHPFHFGCVEPWLKQTNSCPTCRTELTTDNKQYEQWKKDKQAREEEQRGVQNALSHNEFMYN